MIESEHFFAALHVLSEVLPFQKQLSPETRSALWELFPPEAKRDLTPADLQWAVAQRLIDPDPPKDVAISSVLIHYLYPKRDGWPALDAGPRRLDPRTTVRDEQKVFRAGVDGSAVPAMSGVVYHTHWPTFCDKDGGETTVPTDAQAHAMAQPTLGELMTGVPSFPAPRKPASPQAQQEAQPGEALCRDPLRPWLGVRPESHFRESTPIHSGGEGPDGPTPPIWTDPNWMGGSRRA